VRWVAGLVVVALTGVALSSAPADAAGPRLEEALQQRQEVQGRLDELLQRILALGAELEATQAQLDALIAQRDGEQAQAAAADSTMRAQARESYIRGSTDPGLSVFTSDNPQQAAEQARLLSALAHASRQEYETANAAGIRTGASVDEISFTQDELEARKATLQAESAEAERLVQEAQAEEERIRAVIAAEEEARRRAAEEAARRAAEEEAARRRQAQAAAPSAPAAPRGGGGGGGAAQPPATVNGDIACPVGQPRNYSDTYGAPRSGGRSHKGTDILAPHGTPIYAYEDGTVSRMNSNSLGGISLYLQGDSGNLYYYTHLSGYVSGVRAGQRVSVGQHIAMNGATGNAPVPHLHFEVMPGGGGNVNPYPYVARACG